MPPQSMRAFRPVDQSKSPQRARPAIPLPVPRFFLYGEPLQQVDESFVHVETIAYRSRRYQWQIRAHIHSDLNQLLFIRHGSGTMEADGVAVSFQAPALLLVPATVVHGFRFARGTRGFVVTTAQPLIRALQKREPQLRRVFAAAACLPLAPQAASVPELELLIDRLRRESVWQAPGNRLAAEGWLGCVLVAGLRLLPPQTGAGTGRSVARYARELAVQPSRLRTACLGIVGTPPRDMLQERVLLEARRALTYTDLTIAQTAFQLGFSDPGYFSRFFSARTGESPQAFRTRTVRPGGS